jgi:hypothetical protein
MRHIQIVIVAVVAALKRWKGRPCFGEFLHSRASYLPVSHHVAIEIAPFRQPDMLSGRNPSEQVEIPETQLGHWHRQTHRLPLPRKIKPATIPPAINTVELLTPGNQEGFMARNAASCNAACCAM